MEIDEIKGTDYEPVEEDTIAAEPIAKNTKRGVSEVWNNFRIIWKENNAWPVLYCTLVANILALNYGITLGYASPAIPDLQTNDEVTSINDTSIIFSALVPFGAMVCGPIAGLLLDVLGRHTTMMLCTFPYTIGWLLIMLTHLTDGHAFLPILYTGRFFTGTGLGFSTSCVPTYIAELSPSPLRGFFVGIFSLSIGLGILLIQLCGIIPGATYYWLTVVPMVTLVVFVILTALTLRETPRWLRRNGQMEKARIVLLWLRGTKYDIDKELDEISEQVSNEKNETICQKFNHKETFYPLLLGCCLAFFPQIGGINAIVFYSEVIFSNIKEISSDADLIAALCVGGAETLGAFALLLFVDKFGRRKLLMVQGISMTVSLATMGVFYVLNSKPYCDPDSEESDCVEALTPISIINIVAFCFSFTAAWGSVPYLVTAELLPLHVRGAGTGIVTCVAWFASTILLLSYEPYQELVNPWGAFFTFSFIMFCAVVFVYKFIPETKGKTLEEIQNYFFKRERRASSFLKFQSKVALTTDYGTVPKSSQL